MNYTLTAAKRTEKGSKARDAEHLPAIVYGAGVEPTALTLRTLEFVKMYRLAGESSLIDLVIDGAPAGKVLVQEVQHDPVSDGAIHVDLRRIDMKKTMTAPVVLKFVGEAPIVKSAGGTLVTNLETVDVKCLPMDLVSHIDVDLSVLTSFDIVIKVKDLKLPSGITVVSPNGEGLIAKAAPALTEEEIKKMEEAGTAAADLAKIEVAGEKEKAEAAAKEAEGKPEAKKEEKKEEKKTEKK